MKKRLIIAAILAFVLSGCQTAEVTESTPEELPVPGSELPEGNLPPQVTPSPVLEEIPVSVQPVEEHIFSTEETIPAETEEPVIPLEDEPSDRGERPTDEQVLEAYHKARESYGWFAGYDDGGLMLDTTDSISVPVAGEEAEWTFFRVTRPELESIETLRAYLKDLFSDEIVDELLKPANNLFVDGPQGGLYAMGAGRGANVNTGAVTEMVLWPEEGDGLCTVQVTIELLWEDPDFPMGVRSYSFPYQKVGDKWVFTHFEAIM